LHVPKGGVVSDGRLDASNNSWSKAGARLGHGADHSAIIKWLGSLTVESPETIAGPPD
jgi:hypothetical protein